MTRTPARGTADAAAEAPAGKPATVITACIAAAAAHTALKGSPELENAAGRVSPRIRAKTRDKEQTVLAAAAAAAAATAVPAATSAHIPTASPITVYGDSGFSLATLRALLMLL